MACKAIRALWAESRILIGKNAITMKKRERQKTIKFSFKPSKIVGM